MRTVLIYTSPARGHLYPMMDVALALRDAGYRVVIQTLADERERVEAQGLEHRPIADAIEALVLEDFRGTHPLSQFKLAFDCWLRRAPHEIEDLEATVAEVKPDLLLVDVNTWGGAIFAQREGLRWAMFMPFCLPTSDPMVPAFGPGFAPPAGALGRLRDTAFRAVLSVATRGELAGLNRLRAEHGLAPLPSYEDLFLQAPLTLYRTAEPFEYARTRWPEGFAALGPGLWAPPGECPDWVHDLPRPRVLVSVSTEIQNDGAIIETALAALADEPGSVIVTTSALDPSSFDAPHDRVRIEKYLPHAAVVPEMDVVVTHGGMGTVQRALAVGVPVCVVPWGRDQSESARRAEVCGGGTFVPRNQLTAARLKAAIHRARESREGAERVAEGFREAGGAKRALELIEQLFSAEAAASRVA
ncbi:MAG: glycosyltransferase [Deltaproteobacteria bacterium]|nr:MAG: glycosyltransferase [Deltaproteobacteria bacterium]